MSKPRIVITGSEGVIGKILAKDLSQGFQVYRIDRVESNGPNYFNADVSDLSSLRRVFMQVGGIDSIVHLAADSRVGADWESVLRNNIIGTRNVYECARNLGVGQVIFASSNHVTGAYEGIPPVLHEKQDARMISVRDPIKSDGDYASSKAYGEALASQFFELFGIRSICLRIGSVLSHDYPTRDPTKRHLKTWLSHRDLVHLFRQSLLSGIGFGIYYGVSNNKGRFWNISNAQKELGYNPVDDASTLVR